MGKYTSASVLEWKSPEIDRRFAAVIDSRLLIETEPRTSHHGIVTGHLRRQENEVSKMGSPRVFKAVLRLVVRNAFAISIAARFDIDFLQFLLLPNHLPRCVKYGTRVS